MRHSAVSRTRIERVDGLQARIRVWWGSIQAQRRKGQAGRHCGKGCGISVSIALHQVNGRVPAYALLAEKAIAVQQQAGILSYPVPSAGTSSSPSATILLCKWDILSFVASVLFLHREQVSYPILRIPNRRSNLIIRSLNPIPRITSFVHHIVASSAGWESSSHLRPPSNPVPRPHPPRKLDQQQLLLPVHTRMPRRIPNQQLPHHTQHHDPTHVQQRKRPTEPCHMTIAPQRKQVRIRIAWMSGSLVRGQVRQGKRRRGSLTSRASSPSPSGTPARTRPWAARRACRRASCGRGR